MRRWRSRVISGSGRPSTIAWAEAARLSIEARWRRQPADRVAAAVAMATAASRSGGGSETSSAASVLMLIWPMSSSGKKPFGMVVYNQTVATKLSTATPSTHTRWRRATSSVRV